MTTEDKVQELTANCLRDQLGWQSVYAYNQEDYGENSLLGRQNQKEVILKRYLKQKLREFNPNLPEEAYKSAILQIEEINSSQTLLATNQEKHQLLLDGVQVSYRNAKGELIRQTLKILDFDQPSNNHFLAVRELWIQGEIYLCRTDLVGFVNGIPLLFLEAKNLNRDLKAAYDENLLKYIRTIPHLFAYNAFAILVNGIDAKIGSFCGKYEHFHSWKRLAESDPGIVDMETMLKGVCDKNNFIDLLENYILFDNSTGKTCKIIARNHQFLGVNQAIDSVKRWREGGIKDNKLGVFWHTQGSGKSYSMVFFTRKIRRKLGANYTFVICTDREDLDKQIYYTFAGSGLTNNEQELCQASSNEHLQSLLGEHKAYIFTLIQKFNQTVNPDQPYNSRNDIIIISDEAHRTQYGTLASNLRAALPGAGFIGFTGTPLVSNDEITKRYFGDYVSTYDFQRAVEDKATVPLYYDARGDKLSIAVNDLNEQIAAKIEELEIENVEIEDRLERELRRDYYILTAPQRLEALARDFVEHYSTAWETGKAMVICIDKLTCVKLHNLIDRYWSEKIQQLKKDLKKITDDQEENYRQRQIQWMEATLTAVIVSEEQGEIDKFQKQGLDITSHRSVIKNGFELADGTRISPENAFKQADHPFRIAIVCAMWLTGFDVPSLSTLYLDKPLKAHTLMQAIARANRVNEGKTNGLIVDYCGILKNLRQALADLAQISDQGRREDHLSLDPTKPQENLLDELARSIEAVKEFLGESNASLDALLEYKIPSFAFNKAINDAKEAINRSDQARQNFGLLSQEVFHLFKACLNQPSVNHYRPAHDTIKLIYKCIQGDREKIDIGEILLEMRSVIDGAIDVTTEARADDTPLYNISKINFERLKQEFANSDRKNTTVQTLKNAIENRLRTMLEQNLQRTNFQEHYERIVADYNFEKDRVAIEQTFEALLEFIQELDQESQRAVSEGLDEESLAVFDLLTKKNLSPQEIEKIKQIATQLLKTLKQEKLKIDRWPDKESSRAEVKTTIHNFLYSDDTGLPVDLYTEEEVEEKTEEVFRHIRRVYPSLPSPYYRSAA